MSVDSRGSRPHRGAASGRPPARHDPPSRPSASPLLFNLALRLPGQPVRYFSDGMEKPAVEMEDDGCGACPMSHFRWAAARPSSDMLQAAPCCSGGGATGTSLVVCTSVPCVSMCAAASTGVTHAGPLPDCAAGGGGGGGGSADAGAVAVAAAVTAGSAAAASAASAVSVAASAAAAAAVVAAVAAAAVAAAASVPPALGGGGPATVCSRASIEAAAAQASCRGPPPPSPARLAWPA